MIFRSPRDTGERPDLEKRLRSLEQNADVALPGFDAQFHNRAGDLCVAAGQRERSRRYYGRAIDAYLRAGRYNAAGAICRKLLRVAPGTVRARSTLAWLSIGKGMAADAQREVDDYVAAAVAAGQEDLARRQIRMMARATRHPDLRAFLAHHLRQLGAPAAADQVIARADGEDEDEALWSRVLRAALMGPEDLRDSG